MYNLTAHEQAKAREYLELRFRDASRYEDAISMAYLELNYVSAEELANYDEDLLDIYERDEYIPESVLNYCAIEDALPVRVDFFNKVVKMVYAVNEQPDLDDDDDDISSLLDQFSDLGLGGDDDDSDFEF